MPHDIIDNQEQKPADHIGRLLDNSESCSPAFPLPGSSVTHQPRQMKCRAAFSFPVDRNHEVVKLIALNDFSFLVVLPERASHYILLTAYPVERGHDRRKLQNEYERAEKL